MLISKVNRTNAEKVFIVVNNMEATSITTGMGCTFCNAANGAAAAASADGIQVIRVSSSNDMLNFAGIAAQDIITGGFGLSQVWGYNSSIMMSHRASNTTVGAGIIQETLLIPSATLVGTFTSTAGQDALSIINPGANGRLVCVFDTVVLSLSAHSPIGVFGKGFIRAL